MKTKTCIKCEREKPETDFKELRYNRSGKRAVCGLCESETEIRPYRFKKSLMRNPNNHFINLDE